MLRDEFSLCLPLRSGHSAAKATPVWPKASHCVDRRYSQWLRHCQPFASLRSLHTLQQRHPQSLALDALLPALFVATNFTTFKQLTFG